MVGISPSIMDAQAAVVDGKINLTLTKGKVTTTQNSNAGLRYLPTRHTCLTAPNTMHQQLYDYNEVTL